MEVDCNKTTKRYLAHYLHFKQGVPVILDEYPGQVLSYGIGSNVSDNTDSILRANLGRVKGVLQIPGRKYVPRTVKLSSVFVQVSVVLERTLVTVTDVSTTSVTVTNLQFFSELHSPRRSH